MQNLNLEKLSEEMKSVQIQLHQLELDKALDDLKQKFDLWDKGNMNSFELNQELYLYQKNTAKELFLKYERPSFADINIAQALNDKLINKEDISEELYEFLLPKMNVLKNAHNG